MQVFYREIDGGQKKQNDREKKKKKQQPRYLYFELLKLVEDKNQSLLDKLQQDLKVDAKHRLARWSLPRRRDDQPLKARQDAIPNGVVSQYTQDQLEQSNNASFASPQFYDYNQYLPQLLLTAQIVDDDFHESIQQMFGIDKTSKTAKLDFKQIFLGEEEQKHDRYGDGVIVYTRGPVKLMERAVYKAQNDYVHEAYPTSACVLDFNRCSLIFNDIPTMLTALDLFVKKVEYYQSGSIIQIVRVKNGFVEYAKQPQYADIKLNVLIKGSHHNIVGEVQFLLNTMKAFKNSAHNLYAIERRRETIEGSMSKILPALLDRTKRVWIAGNLGDVKSLCKAMVIDGCSPDVFLHVDNHKTIVNSLCKFGHLRALQFVRRTLLSDTQRFIDHLFTDDTQNTKPIEWAVRNSRIAVVQYLFAMPAVKEKYSGNMDLLYRLIYHCFTFNRNQQVVDCVLTELAITDKVADIVRHRCATPTRFSHLLAPHYQNKKIFVELVGENTVTSLKKLISLIGGEQVFVEQHAFNVDAKVPRPGITVLEYAIWTENCDVIKYLLSLPEMRKKYVESDANQWLWRALWYLFKWCKEPSTMDFVLQQLELDGAKLAKLVAMPGPMNKQQFHKWTLMKMVANWSFFSSALRVNSLKKMREILDDVTFAEGVVAKANNEDAMTKAIERKKVEMVQFLLSVDAVRKKCAEDQEELHLMLSTLNRIWDDSVSKVLVQELALTEEKLSALKQKKGTDIARILSMIKK